MTLDLTDLEAALLLKELNGQGDPCQDQTRAGARASTTAAEALRPAADDYGAEAHRALNLRRTPPSIRAERRRFKFASPDAGAIRIGQHDGMPDPEIRPRLLDGTLTRVWRTGRTRACCSIDP